MLTPAADTRTDIDTALGVLVSYSLFTLSGGAIATHRLVQNVTRAQLRHSALDGAAGRDQLGDPSASAGPGAEDTTWPAILRVALDLLGQAEPPRSPDQEVTGWGSYGRWSVLPPGGN